MLLNVKLYDVMHCNYKGLARIYVLRKVNMLHGKILWLLQKNVYMFVFYNTKVCFVTNNSFSFISTFC